MEQQFHLQQLAINPTNQCNLRCTYCFTDHNNREMTLQTAKDAISFLWNQRNIEEDKEGEPSIFINWFGGEPMLKFEEIIKPTMMWAEQQNYKIGWGISTNGTLLTPARLEFFKHYNCGILFSFDGIEMVQNDQRPTADDNGSWDLIKDNLKLFGKYPKGIFRSTVPARNVDKLCEGYCVARDYDFATYFPGLVYEDTEWNDEKYRILFEQCYHMSLLMYYDVTNTGKCTQVEPLIRAIKNRFKKPDVDFSIYRCGLGTNTAGVSPEGYLFGCQEHSTYSGKEDVFYIGDIYNGIDAERHQQLLDSYKKGFELYDAQKECQDCIYRHGCYLENCPSMTLRTIGDFAKLTNTFCVSRKIWDDCANIILTLAAGQENKVFRAFVENETIGEILCPVDM